jgi:hypothetical protein
MMGDRSRFGHGGELGHEIIVYRDRHAMVHDMDLWAIRHFLLVEAEASDNSEAATFVRGWDWVGPGVMTGVEFDSFLHGDAGRERAFAELLIAARARIESFGQDVPLGYIASNINTPLAYFAAAQPVERWVRKIVELGELVAPHRKPEDE